MGHRRFLLDRIEQMGLAPVNGKYQPQVKRDKILKKLLRTGKIKLVRYPITARSRSELFRKKHDKRQSYVTLA